MSEYTDLHAGVQAPVAAPSIIFGTIAAIIHGPDGGPWEAVHPDPPLNGAALNIDDIPDLSLGEDWYDDGRSRDHVEPPPISAEAYFDLTDEEKREVARDAGGRPYGYWSWSKEAWDRYGRENPRTPNAGAPRESVNAEPTPAPITIRGFNPADWEGVKAPPRLWVIQDYIPARTVTLLYADGGTGKSYLKLQLAVARALGKEWIGLMPEPGRTLVLSTEDDLDEMWRRIEGMLPFFGARMADLGDIRLIDLVGENSVLGLLTKGIIEPTPMYGALDAYMAEFKPGLVELDVLADLFSGEENNRPQVTQFVGLLKRLCRKHQCATLLLAQPSVAGMNTGSGTSGSTGWSNSGRSRLYFQRVKTEDGGEPNKNLRTFEGKKSNYGEVGGKFDVQWKGGLFRRVSGSTGFDKAAAEQEADNVFLKLLRQLTKQNIPVRATVSRSGAPVLFAARKCENQGLNAKDFEAAMHRLLARGAIRNELETEGPPSKRDYRLVIP